jgi:hypothetical protein
MVNLHPFSDQPYRQEFSVQGAGLSTGTKASSVLILDYNQTLQQGQQKCLDCQSNVTLNMEII